MDGLVRIKVYILLVTVPQSVSLLRLGRLHTRLWQLLSLAERASKRPSETQKKKVPKMSVLAVKISVGSDPSCLP